MRYGCRKRKKRMDEEGLGNPGSKSDPIIQGTDQGRSISREGRAPDGPREGRL
jgi:hypothetical protein